MDCYEYNGKKYNRQELIDVLSKEKLLSDSKWRYEIIDDIEVDNFNAGLEKDGLYGEDTFVSDFLDPNSKLLKAYPQLKDTKVIISRKKINSSTRASFSSSENKITLYANNISGMFKKDGGMEGAKSTFLHEVQHAIQRIEGFAIGGNKRQMSSPNDVLQNLASPLNFPKLSKEDRIIARQQTKEQGLRFGEVFYFDVIKDDPNVIEDVIERLEILNNISPNYVYTKLIQALDYKLMEMGGEDVAFDKYKKLAGEVEARNVQKRMDMSPEQRRQTLLQETEDVAREDQIILQDGIEGLASAINEGSVKFSAAEQDLDMVKATNEADKITLKYNDKGQHLAPNGKPSNLTESQAKIVRTPAFKNWFGDWENDPKNASKVVDSNGEPMVVYHGTDASFTEFDINKKGSNTKAPDTKLGFFFAETNESAKLYGDNVLPVFLNIRSIKESQNLVEYYNQENLVNTLKYYTNNFGDTKENLGDWISSYFALPKDYSETDLKGRLSKEEDVLSKMNRPPNINETDGLKTPMFKSKDKSQYIAFNPNQVKLADGTNQTFNPNTNDIRFSAAENQNQATPQMASRIVNNAIEHLKELNKKGLEALRAEKDLKKKDDIRKTIVENNKVIAHLVKAKKDPKFSEGGTYRAVAIAVANGQSIVAALDSPVATSLQHELFHVHIEPFLETDPEAAELFRKEYKEQFGEDKKGWDTDLSEFTARLYEKYLSNGRELTEKEVKNPSIREKLNEAFRAFTEFMKDIIISYKGKNIEVSPAAQAYFDKITGIDTQKTDSTGETDAEAGVETPKIEDESSPKSMHRYTLRTLKSSKLPKDYLEAVRTGARSKTAFPDKLRDQFAEEFTQGIETIEDIEDATEALVQQIQQKVLAVSNASEGTNPAAGAWEITALRILEKKAYDFHGPKAAVKIHNILQALSSLSAHMLRSYAGNSQHTFFVEVFSRLKKTEEPLMNKKTASGKTTSEVAEDVTNIIDETIKENLEELRAKVKAEVLAEIEAAKKTAPKPKEEPTTISKKLSESLRDKSNKYLNAYNKKVGNTLQSGVNIDALVDYSLYLYYKFAGSLIKTKENLSKKFGEKVVEDNWGIILDNDGFIAATEDIARLKLMAALEKTIDITPESQVLNQKGKTPSQLIIQSIVRHLNKKDITPNRKSIEEIIEQKDLDIAVVNTLRSDIEAGIMVITDLAKRAEIQNQVDDLLASLIKSRMDTLNLPWTTKTKTRDMVKNSLKSLDLTVDEILKDVTNRNKVTDTVEEEFISRTGLSKEDAAPYIDIIKNNIEDFVSKKIGAAARAEVNKSYGSNIQKIGDAINSLKEQIEAEKAIIQELNDKIAAIKKEDPNLKVKTNAFKARRNDNLKKLTSLERDLKNLEQKKANKIELLEEKAGRITNESTIKQIGAIVRNEGLNEDSIRKIFAEKIGAKAFTQKDADSLRKLYNTFDGAKFEADKKRSYEELASFIFRLNPDDSRWMADVLESYMYSNILGAMRTSDLAFIAGFANFTYSQLMQAPVIELSKDLYNLLKGKGSFENIRALGAAFANIGNSNASWAGAYDVFKGAKGLNIQDYGSNIDANKSQKSLSVLKRMREKRDMNRESGNKVKSFAIQSLIAHNVMARGLVVMDYGVSSNAMPILLHRNLREEAIKELAEEGLVDPGLATILSRVNEKLGLDKIEAQLKAEGFVKDAKNVKDINAYKKRKGELIFEFLPEESIAKAQAEDAIGVMTLAGRASGYSGLILSAVNRGFSGASTMAGSLIPAESKNSSAFLILSSLFKMNTMPFAGAVFKLAQQWKNAQPIVGALQININEDGNVVWRRPVQLAKESRFYNGFNNKVETLDLPNWRRQERASASLIPTLALLGMLSSFFDFDDEEGDIKLNPENDIYFTTAYSPKIANLLKIAGVNYEAYTAYKITPEGKSYKVERLYNYKDFIFAWPLASIGSIQERKMAAYEEKEGQFDKNNSKDPLKIVDAMALMFKSSTAFGFQNSLTNSLGAVTAIAPAIEGSPLDTYEVKRLASSQVRMFTPISALQAELNSYLDFVTRSNIKKGSGFFSDVYDRMLFTGWATDTEDFDLLGRPLQQNPWGPAITTLFTNLVNKFLPDAPPRAYKELEDLVLKYPDVTKITKMYPESGDTDDKVTLQTIIKPIADPNVVHEIKKYAQDQKALILQEKVNALKSKGGVTKSGWQDLTEKANTEGNQLGWIYYYNKVLDNSGEEGRRLKFDINQYILGEGIKSTESIKKAYRDAFIDGAVGDKIGTSSYRITEDGVLEKLKYKYISRYESEGGPK
ncbi:MAG: hypothetical protein WAZ19_02495 [Anaerolineae bacterium]